MVDCKDMSQVIFPSQQCASHELCLLSVAMIMHVSVKWRNPVKEQYSQSNTTSGLSRASNPKHELYITNVLIPFWITTACKANKTCLCRKIITSLFTNIAEFKSIGAFGIMLIKSNMTWFFFLFSVHRVYLLRAVFVCFSKAFVWTNKASIIKSIILVV